MLQKFSNYVYEQTEIISVHTKCSSIDLLSGDGGDDNYKDDDNEGHIDSDNYVEMMAMWMRRMVVINDTDGFNVPQCSAVRVSNYIVSDLKNTLTPTHSCTHSEL